MHILGQLSPAEKDECGQKDEGLQNYAGTWPEPHSFQILPLLPIPNTAALHLKTVSPLLPPTRFSKSRFSPLLTQKPRDLSHSLASSPQK